MDEDRRRYLQAKAIVVAADELPDAEHEAFIATECGKDGALRAEVAWLQKALAAETTTGVPQRQREAPDLSGAEVAGVAGSGYSLLRRLGRGGMGVVYLAERRPGAGVQQVALKLIDGEAWPQAEAERHFAREAAILARLSHPNIARLLDAGRLADGRPFLAMEYVEGERIDHWCEARALPLEARLRLFLKVCAAVEYAHHHLVVHRDLKPGNILVDTTGEPRLLDFGIARLIDEEGATTRTATGQRALTLAYASPEQIRNTPLSTASDVWQLGVVLYELVSGVRPFPHTESPLGLSHAILTSQPPPPSRARSVADSRVRRVPADVDAIVLKAMRTNPAERYPAASEFAADLRRFLDSRPVLAQRGQRWYHLRRFVARHRGAVAAGTLLTALLAGFGIDRQAQLHRTEVERDKAQALASFMRELFEDADPSRTHGNRITVADALDLGVERLRQQPDLDPQVRAALLLSIGRGYTALDLGDRSIPLLRQADTLLNHSGAEPLERGLTLAALGRAYSMVLDTPSSITTNREAIALLERSPGDHTDDILRVRINLLFGHITVGDLPLHETIGQLDAIVAELDARIGPDRELLAQALAARGLSHLASGQDDLAAADADRALAIGQTLYHGDDPALIYYRFTAALARIRSDTARAVGEFHALIADYENINGTPTPGLGVLLAHFGWALAGLGRYEEAEQALRRAEEVARRYAGSAPDFHRRTVSGLAEQLHALGRDDEAAILLEPELPLFERHSAHGATWAVNAHASALNVLGGIALRRGEAETAASHFRDALALHRQHPASLSERLHQASRLGLCTAQAQPGGCTP